MQRMDFLWENDEILEELIKETKEFSLTDFYLDKCFMTKEKLSKYVPDPYKIDGAIQIISPKQVFSSYSWDNHQNVFDNICSVALKNYYEVWEPKSDLRNLSYKLGVICIMAAPLFTEIIVPEKINEYQYENLMNVLEELKQINLKKEKLSSPKVAVTFNIKNQSLDTEEALLILKNIIGSVEYHDELIVSDNINPNVEKVR